LVVHVTSAYSVNVSCSSSVRCALV
jgi:hypothetical protein